MNISVRLNIDMRLVLPQKQLNRERDR